MHEFKNTEIGRIQKEWGIKKVIDLFSVETGTTPSTKQNEYWGNGDINWITPADMSKLDNQMKITNSDRKITGKALKESNLTLMPKGSIIISSRAPVGYVGVVEKETAFNQGCKGLIPKEKLNTDFYGYYFVFRKNYLSNISGGSTFKELSKDLLENFEVPFPPVPEQEKIAEILSTVDEAIQKTDQAIEKTQKLKKGLMNELLTKGIDSTQQTVDRKQGKAKREFKDTELGRIPKEWKVSKLKEVATVRYGLGQPPELSTDGIPMIRATNIKSGKIYKKDLVYVQKDVVPISRNPFLKEGDILIVRSGAYTGDIAYISEEWEGAVAGYDLIVTPSKDTDSRFLTYYLLSPLIQNRYFYGQKVRSAQSHLNSSQAEETPVLLPPIDEQQKIAEIIGSIDEKIEFQRRRKEKFERMKKGLMEELLTGKKRVKVA